MTNGDTRNPTCLRKLQTRAIIDLPRCLIKTISMSMSMSQMVVEINCSKQALQVKPLVIWPKKVI